MGLIGRQAGIGSFRSEERTERVDQRGRFGGSELRDIVVVHSSIDRVVEEAHLGTRACGQTRPSVAADKFLGSCTQVFLEAQRIIYEAAASVLGAAQICTALP